MSEKILTLEGTREEFVKAKNALDEINVVKEAIEKKRKEYLADAEARFNAENNETLTAIAKAQTDFAKANTNYRQEVLNTFKETNEKQVDSLSYIRVGTSLKYKEADALEWCMKHGLALDVNKKSFEAIVNTSKDVPTQYPFVQVMEVYSVVIGAKRAK